MSPDFCGTLFLMQLPLLLLMALAGAASKAECLTLTQARSLVCSALCAQDGADLGYYVESSGDCVCGFKKKYAEMKRTKILIKTFSNTESEGK